MKVTYKAIQAEYRARYGKTVKTCWIAHIKRDHDATTRVAPNRSGKEASCLCPPDIYPQLKKVMLDLGAIKPKKL
ncbi:MAG: hypothetical protein ACR2PY_03780 [Salinispira sp.]